MAGTRYEVRFKSLITMRTPYAHYQNARRAITEIPTPPMCIACDTSNNAADIPQPLSIANTAATAFLPSLYDSRTHSSLDDNLRKWNDEVLKLS